MSSPDRSTDVIPKAGQKVGERTACRTTQRDGGLATLHRVMPAVSPDAEALVPHSVERSSEVTVRAGITTETVGVMR